MRGQTARHGGSWTPRINRVPPQPNPAPRLFPPDGRKVGAFFDAAGSHRCGGRQPGMAGYERPVSPVYRPNRIQRPGFSFRTGGRPGRFLTPPVLGDAEADTLAWRVMDTPYRPCTAPTESSASVFPSGREESGRLFWGAGYSAGHAAVCDILPGPAESKKTGSPCFPLWVRGCRFLYWDFSLTEGEGLGGLVLVGLGPVVQVQGVVLGDVVA